MSAGIDLALWLAAEIAGRERVEAIQLVVEYDSSSSVRSRPYKQGSPEVRRLANAIMDESIPGDQRRLVSKIAWRRLVDWVRTGR